MKRYKFKFSVIMAVYNVEAYLREAINSLVQQTIGFSHIQLILVDDGSTDKSGDICDEYQKKHPENVFVIHKKNGGASSARNAGLSLVEGEYLNFLDGDDKMDRTAFEKVLRFFDMHGEETDVVAIPIQFFDAQTGDHIQNSKFLIDQEVIDLYENPCVTNLSVASSFIRSSSTQGILFDTRLTNCEDAKYCLIVLMQKMTLGLVRDTVYWYRKRLAGEQSATQSATRKESWYIPYLSFFSNWALDTAKNQFGSIPKFIQYEVMYDLQWKVEQARIPGGVLTDEKMKEYKSLLTRTVSRIDDDIILQQKHISDTRKLFLINQVKGKNLTICKSIDDTKRSILFQGRERKQGDVDFYVSKSGMIPLSGMYTKLEFARLAEDCQSVQLEGHHHIYSFDFENMDIKPVLFVNGTIIACEEVNREHMQEQFLGKPFTQVIGFRCRLPLQKKAVYISPGLLVDDIVVSRRTYRFGKFFPVSDIYENAYALLGNRMLFLYEDEVCVSPKTRWISRTVRECRLLSEIWEKDLLGGRKAVAGRLFYHFVKPLKHKKIWIITDRAMKADDNGEALFSYLMAHKVKNTKVYFAISKNSKDYARIEKIGKCIDYMSFRHKLLHLISDTIISSHADGVRNPFLGYHDALRDLLAHQQFVFLQHGITKDDVSGWLNRYNQDIDGFVTSAKREYESIENGNYHYSSDQIWLTGMPRFDRLYRDEKNWISVLPTWRRYLMTDINPDTGQWGIVRNFDETDYFQFYNNLLNNDRLLDSLQKHGYTLVFFPHPNLQQFTGRFQKDPRVVFLPSDTSYREIYAKSNLLITDYSSAVFDFAYLRKPIIYCQFDKDVFFSGVHNYSEGYFDYERDGFGEVEYNLDSTIDRILEYAANHCRLKEMYQKRIDSFFAFDDKNNSQRVLDKILAIPERK